MSNQKPNQADWLSQFQLCRKTAVPLVAIETSDPAPIVDTIRGTFGENPPAMLGFDLSRGLFAINEAGARILQAIINEYPDEYTAKGALRSPDEALRQAAMLPGLCIEGGQITQRGGILFVYGSHRMLVDTPEGAAICAAVWNNRDAFKRTSRTIVFLTPQWVAPSELQQDVMVLTDSLPSAEAHREKAVKMHEQNSIEIPDDSKMELIVNELMGQNYFMAEQNLSLSFTREGIDLNLLRMRSRKTINSTPGLSIYEGPETFDSIGGCDRVKWFLKRIFEGRQPPLAIMFIDEIEKMFQGAGGDTSGVSSDMLATFLTWTQAVKATGNIFIGLGGTAKSAIAKAAGNEANLRTIVYDAGAVKNSLVGSSEARVRGAFNVVEAVSQGRVHIIATCNNMGALPPEVLRRFRLGTFYFDVPTKDERDSIWSIYLKKFDLTEFAADKPDDTNWTGAEIESCCEMAWRMRVDLKEAAKQIVPIAVSGKKQLESLRGEADGNYLSALYEGKYQRNRVAPVQNGQSNGRTIAFSGETV